jgi:hypothetical protein
MKLFDEREYDIVKARYLTKEESKAEFERSMLRAKVEMGIIAQNAELRAKLLEE